MHLGQPIEQRSRTGLQDDRRLDLVQLAIAHRGNRRPARPGGDLFRPEKVAARPGWETIPAVRHGDLYEIKSPIILQPGPAALFDGLDEIHRIIAAWALR